MGFKFRKSLKIAPGVRINLTSKGVSSVSLGKTGAKVNIGKKRVRTTVGIPGTGLSYSTSTPLKQQAPKPKIQLKPLKNGLWYYGILFLPIVFAWFTLNKERFNTLERVLSFIWLPIHTLFLLAVFL